MPTDRPVSPNRSETDARLADERTQTDEAFATAQAEEVEERVVRQARARAEVELEAARRRQDQRLDADHASDATRRRVTRDRDREDMGRDAENAQTAARLDDERRLRSRTLSHVIDSERAATNQALGAERIENDKRVAARDATLGRVGHDLRSMLQGIVSDASLIALLAEANEQIQTSTQRIERFTMRMERLIGDLLDIVSIEGGQVPIVPQRHDACRLVREAVEMFEASAAAKGIEISAGPTGDPKYAMFDFDRAFQVMANLLGNAIKFTPEQGRIDVSVVNVGDEVLFSVSDTGRGIAPDQLERIFERAWQADPSAHTGLGLGLFISKGIVEAHGGKIWAESKLGAGTTVHFALHAALPPTEHG